MKKMILVIFVLLISPPFLLNDTFAGFAPAKKTAPKVPAKVKAKATPQPKPKQPAPKKEAAKPAPQPRCREGGIRNHLYCPDSMVAYRQFVCRNGRYVWEDVINQADCPAVPAGGGEPAGEEPPVVMHAGDVPIVLPGCGDSDGFLPGGWRDGARYILNSDIYLERPRRHHFPAKCFLLYRQHDIEIDCQGHKITIRDAVMDSANIFAIRESQNITVKNCELVDELWERFHIGIVVELSHGSQIIGNTLRRMDVGIYIIGGSGNHIRNNILDNSTTGVSLSRGRNPGENGTNTLSNNTGCNNDAWDLRCDGDFEDDPSFVIQGSGNTFNHIHDECPAEWAGNLYQPCPQ